MTRKHLRLQKKSMTKRRRYKAGMNIILPFCHYIHDSIADLSYKTVLYGVQIIDIHTDLFMICGLDMEDHVWFGYQYMTGSFYENYMKKVGITNPDSLILRKYTLDGFSHKEVKVQEITEDYISLTIFHPINIISEFQISWKRVYRGKELYNMITLQCSLQPQLPPPSDNEVISPMKPSKLPKKNTIANMVSPTPREMMRRMNQLKKRKLINEHIQDHSGDLENIHGIGEKTLDMLAKKNINTIEKLRYAITIDPTLLNYAQTIGLQYYEDLKEPIPRHEVEKYESRLQEILKKIEPGMKMTIAGSYRRNKVFSHDIDVLFTHPQKPELDRDAWLDMFVGALVEENIKVVYLTQTSPKRLAIIKMPELRLYRRIDFMVVSYSTYPFALLYLTGPKEFTVNMRNISIQKGYSLSENGFKDLKTNERINVNNFKSEKDIFDFLEMDYLEPSERG